MKRVKKKGSSFPERIYEFDFKTKKEEGSQDVYIEGYANRAMAGGQKIIDRGKEHIPASEWKIDDWKKNPIIFFNHDRDFPIGQGVAAKITEDGLWIKAKISNSRSPEISRVRDLISEGILKTFSVGIDVAEEVYEDDGSITLKGVTLLENSVVSIPMNQESFFSISQKMLKDTSLAELEHKITYAKGAWVAAAIHNRIFEMQSSEEDFNRANALTEIATMAEISQGELMDMLAGNTAVFSEDVLNAVSSILGMDIAELEKLNQADMDVGNSDASLNPDEEIEEEADDEALEEEAEGEPASNVGDDEEAEELPEEDSEGEPASNVGDDEEEELLDEEGKQADQGVDTSSPDNSPRIPDLPKVGEIEDFTNMSEAVDDKTPVEEAAKKELEEKSAFQECVGSKVRTLLDEGKPQDQAIAIAISMCSEGKECKPMDAKDWEKLLSDISEHKKEKELGDNSNGPTGPLGTVTDTEVNQGQPQIIAAQQTNVLLGQLIAEMQKTNKLLENLVSSTPQKPEEVMPSEGEEMELMEDSGNDDEPLADVEEEDAEDDGSKALGIIESYKEKLNKNLSRFGC